MNRDRLIGIQAGVYQPTHAELDEIYRLALSSLNLMARRRWFNHNKTGHMYQMIGTATLQAPEPIELKQNTELVVYQALVNDAYYIRTPADFEPRFTEYFQP